MIKPDTKNEKNILPEGYEERHYSKMSYGLFVPPNYDSTKSYPLVLRLHGSTDTVSWNLSWYNEPIASTDPCIVLTPKSFVEKTGWGTSWDSNHSKDMSNVLEILELIKNEYNIDESRLYVHGSSMGGYGVFSLLAKEPGLFAAAVAICGGGDPLSASNLKQTPLWIFHGSNDPVVPVMHSRNIYNAILNAGGSEVRYTEYPGVEHNSWDAAFKESTLIPWILAQNKGVQYLNPDPVEELNIYILANGRIKLDWISPSSLKKPNNEVWYYKIFRNNELIAELDNLHTSYIDNNPGNVLEYSIKVVNYFFKNSDRNVIRIDPTIDQLAMLD